MQIKTANIHVKTKLIKMVVGDVVVRLKLYHHCSVECYWHCSDGTVHYRSEETVNFCSFRCANTSPITILINFVFFTFVRIYKWFYMFRFGWWWRHIHSYVRTFQEQCSMLKSKVFNVYLLASDVYDCQSNWQMTDQKLMWMNMCCSEPYN